MKQSSPKVKTNSTPQAGSLPETIFILAGVCIAGLGIYQSVSLRWVSDDAFITFRYVQNFIAGHGIVYNPGEYVEGYTHFLWLLILSAGKSIGLDPVSTSIWLGILCYITILILFIIIAAKEHRKLPAQSTKGFFIPLAAALLALNYDMNIWASGGLETSLYTLLISLAFYMWFYTHTEEKKRLLFAGSILLLATLTRPDGALFILTGGLLLLAKGLKDKDSLFVIAKRIGLLILPSVIIGIPYLLWKKSYYGDIFPATYYAKSADHNYFGQGFFYILLYFRVYFITALAIIALGVVSYRRKARSLQSAERPFSEGSSLICAGLAIAIYLLMNVARVGGDFMFARFMIPVLPLLYFMLERFIKRLSLPSMQYLALTAIIIAASFIGERGMREKIMFRTDERNGQQAGNWNDDGGGETRGIADERWVYYRPRITVNGVPRGSLDVYSDVGRSYEPFFRGLPITVAINGAQNMIAYYANFQTVINEYGLTDSFIAHMPVTTRGRIGHEKKAPESYFADRGVTFQLFSIVPKLPKQLSLDMAIFEMPEMGLYQIAKVITYDSTLIHELEKRYTNAGVRVILPKYEEILPNYLENMMDKLSADQVENDYLGFKQVYFKRYPHPEAEKRIQEYIEKKRKEKS